MARRKRTGPRIRRVVGTRGRGAGKPLAQVHPGETLRIIGSGFGEKPAQASVWFDEIRAEPFAIPFSDTSMLVTAPFCDGSTRSLVVTVGRDASNAVRFRVLRPPRSRAAPGSELLAFMHELDQYAALVAALGRQMSPAVTYSREIRQAADYLDGCRRVLKRNIDLLMQWQDGQRLAGRIGVPFEALRTIERTDELIRTAGLTRQLRGLTSGIFGPAGALGRLAGESLAEWLFGDDGESLRDSVPSAVLGAIGFILKEGVKILEGAENLLKIFVPSASLDGGPSLGGELTIGVDVSFSIGEGVSAIAKGVDVVSQIFELIFGDDVGEKVDRLEEKADRHAEVLVAMEEKADRQGEQLGMIEQKADRQEEKLDRLEQKDDRQEEKLDRLEQKADRQGEQLDMLEQKDDRQEEKLDRLEQKADRQEEKLDVIEAKADRQEGKLDRLEEKNDRQEEKLDRLEGKADAQEQKLDSLESKADRQEQKLDRLEGKADREEQKLDALEGKADRQEQKLDALEGKADRQEQKLDRLEEKSDRQEQKLDRVEEKNDREEQKLDRIEEKLDREEEKLDRLILAAPLEGAIATQQGASRNVTAVVSATRGLDDSVHLRAAVDVPASRIDVEAAWSDWVSFGRPGTALGLLEVSVDVEYDEASDTVLNALLSARDQAGIVFHRGFEGVAQDQLLDPARWTDWQSFLGQP